MCDVTRIGKALLGPNLHKLHRTSIRGPRTRFEDLDLESRTSTSIRGPRPRFDDLDLDSRTSTSIRGHRPRFDDLDLDSRTSTCRPRLVSDLIKTEISNLCDVIQVSKWFLNDDVWWRQRFLVKLYVARSFTFDRQTEGRPFLVPAGRLTSLRRPPHGLASVMYTIDTWHGSAGGSREIREPPLLVSCLPVHLHLTSEQFGRRFDRHGRQMSETTPPTAVRGGGEGADGFLAMPLFRVSLVIVDCILRHRGYHDAWHRSSRMR